MGIIVGVFFLAWVLKEKKHYWSAILFLALNKHYITTYDNYLILFLIATISFSPEIRYIEKSGYKVATIDWSLFVRGLLFLYVIGWYFGYLNPLKDFAVSEKLLSFTQNYFNGLFKDLRVFLIGF